MFEYYDVQIQIHKYKYTNTHIIILICEFIICILFQKWRATGSEIICTVYIIINKANFILYSRRVVSGLTVGNKDIIKPYMCQTKFVLTKGCFIQI